MGRPPKPPEQVRRNRATTFFTDDEYAELERKARERGVALSVIVYEIVARSLRRRR